MGRFSKVSKAEASNQGQYFKEGHHTVKIKAIKAFDSSKGDGLVATIEAECVESTNPDMKIGGLYSQILMLDKHKSAPGNWIAFLGEICPAAGLGDLPEDGGEREAIMESITGDEQPLAGTEMRVEVWMTKTKRGGDFTLHRWDSATKAA